MQPFRAKSIAIIGAGPSGVIAAKYLRAEKAFDKIVLFEQRSTPGGIWRYTADQIDEKIFSIPQTNPHQGLQQPDWKPKQESGVESDGHVTNGHNQTNGTNGHHGSSKASSFLSPMYEKLETNIPRGLMGFQGLNWPEESQLFPTHQTVLQYIEDYGKDVQDLVRYETQVVEVVPTDSSATSSWTVTTRGIRDSKESQEVFDAVIVANGHFIVPYLPDIPGIKGWNERYPGSITHSKYFRRAEDFTGKKVIVVGNSASGSDLSNQIANHCKQPLIWSTRSESLFSASHGTADERRKAYPPIAEFKPDEHSVVFTDGTIETNIDAIVYATGYFYNLPFLENVEPALITDGSHVNHTFQHLFFAPRPTLSFLTLNQRVIPFPLAEAQAAVVARVYSGRLSLPSLTEMQAWERSTEAEMGNGKNFHLLPFPKDGNYINAMSSWARSAPAADGLENEGQGKVPPTWGAWEFWCRENFPKIRQAFGKLGDKRHQVRSIEEVGFRFEEVEGEGERTTSA